MQLLHKKELFTWYVDTCRICFLVVDGQVISLLLVATLDDGASPDLSSTHFDPKNMAFIYAVPLIDKTY